LFGKADRRLFAFKKLKMALGEEAKARLLMLSSVSEVS
jgi:hypothetical protein